AADRQNTLASSCRPKHAIRKTQGFTTLERVLYSRLQARRVFGMDGLNKCRNRCADRCDRRIDLEKLCDLRVGTNAVVLDVPIPTSNYFWRMKVWGEILSGVL